MRLLPILGGSSAPTGVPLEAANEEALLELVPDTGARVEQLDTGMIWAWQGANYLPAAYLNASIVNNAYAALFAPTRPGEIKSFSVRPINLEGAWSGDWSQECPVISSGNVTSYGWVSVADGFGESGLTTGLLYEAFPDTIVEQTPIYDPVLEKPTLREIHTMPTATLGFDMTFTNAIILIRPDVGTFYYPSGRLQGVTPMTVPEWSAGSHGLDAIVFHNDAYYWCIAALNTDEPGITSGWESSWTLMNDEVITLPAGVPISLPMTLGGQEHIPLVWCGDVWRQISDG